MIRIHLIFLFLINFSFSQQVAQTENGTKVILHKNGTWEYLNNASNKTENNETRVYITYTGKKYHRDGCRYLKSRIESTVRDAQSSGLTPCKVCKPPSQSSYNIPEPAPIRKKVKTPDYGSTRCQAITQKGTQCKRNSQSGGSYCWQHP